MISALAQTKHASLIQKLLHVGLRALQIIRCELAIIPDTRKNKILRVIETSARSEPPHISGKHPLDGIAWIGKWPVLVEQFGGISSFFPYPI